MPAGYYPSSSDDELVSSISVHGGRYNGTMGPLSNGMEAHHLAAARSVSDASEADVSVSGADLAAELWAERLTFATSAAFAALSSVYKRQVQI